MKIFLSFLILFFSTMVLAQQQTIYPGAYNLDAYLPLLKEKRVGIFANATSTVGHEHLVDVLLKHHIHVTKIFAPEHGFRGTENDKVKDTVDAVTKIPIISVYGHKLRPTTEDLKDVDILVFDIQDVGVRFYTYISSLQKLMEAAIDNHKPLIILDRPNPNGFYVDGPVLELKHKSFTGMQPIPIVYGMTIGEYAKMLVGQQWLHVTPKSKANTLALTVIPCLYYTHKSFYEPPIRPSPNLPDIQSIYWYPTIGLFEGTRLSVGRGTDKPFQQFGHPLFATEYCFTPVENDVIKKPPFKDHVCHGWNLSGTKLAVLTAIHHQLQIKYLLEAYRLFPDKKHFFAGFNASAGTDNLEKQIKAGFSEQQIRKSWEPELSEFKKIRKKYLLYPDF